MNIHLRKFSYFIDIKSICYFCMPIIINYLLSPLYSDNGENTINYKADLYYAIFEIKYFDMIVLINQYILIHCNY